MKTEKTHAKQMVEHWKHACINCHPSMKAYYQEQYEKWKKYFESL